MTLKAVAEMANVSIKTASRVLKNEGYASEETRDRVRAVAKSIGYVPNRAAQSMRSGESQTVGLLANLVTNSPFTTDITRAIGQAVEAAGKALFIADGGGDQASRSLRQFAEFQTTKIIFAADYHMSADSLLPDGFQPTALVNCFSATKDIPAFVPDDEGGGYIQAKHILELGHRRVGLIELPDGMVATSLRRRGVEKALGEAGVVLDPDLIKSGQVGPVAARKMVAYEAALSLLQRPNRPTAILCSKDEFALQALGAAAFLGIKVPEDLSIIGFDDMSLISATTRPALTTVRLPYFEMGWLAALAVLDGVQGHSHQHIPCSLIVRESTREV